MNTSKHYIWQSTDWPNLMAADPTVAVALLQARQSYGEVVGKMSALGLGVNGTLIQDVFVQEVLATSAIEGVLHHPDSVRSSVLRKLGIAQPDTIAPISREVDGLVEVIQDAISNCNITLDQDRLCRWHAALFPGGTSGIQKIAVGEYREHLDAMQIVSGKMGQETVHYTAPPSAQVKHEMEHFLAWFERSSPKNIVNINNKMDGVMRAAIAHLWFETIHPFEDGNGRLGRVIMDMALAQDLGESAKLYSLSNQMMQHRSAYYDALNQAQCGGIECSAWVIWFANIFSQACQFSSRLIDEAIKKSQFWHVHAGQDINPRQRKVIQRLLDAGEGGFTGGLNAEKYMKMTGTSKATATRDLGALLRHEILFGMGQGKALRYYINVEGWQHGLLD